MVGGPGAGVGGGGAGCVAGGEVGVAGVCRQGVRLGPAGDPVGAECLLELGRCRRRQVAEHLLGCREGRFQCGVQTFGDLGRVYSVDHVRNQINGSHIDLESRGRELGVLSTVESLVD